MNPDIEKYNELQIEEEKDICIFLYELINNELVEAENKIWHGHPVWFLEGNPVVGYSKLIGGIRLLFWSGQTFEEKILQNEGKFKAAEIRFNHKDEINKEDIIRLLKKSRDIQWDYKNIVKRKGQLEQLK